MLTAMDLDDPRLDPASLYYDGWNTCHAAIIRHLQNSLNDYTPYKQRFIRSIIADIKISFATQQALTYFRNKCPEYRRQQLTIHTGGRKDDSSSNT